jgi:hypothetical protein
MGGQKINARLTLTIVVQLVILVAIGLIAYVGMNRISGAVSQINQSVTEQASLGRLGEILRADLLTVVNSVARGASTWEQGMPPCRRPRRISRKAGKRISTH